MAKTECPECKTSLPQQGLICLDCGKRVECKNRSERLNGKACTKFDNMMCVEETGWKCEIRELELKG